MHRLRVGIAQINTTVGDFAGNADKILKVIEESRSSGVDLLTFPELAICGYPPEDLLFKPKFISENLRTLEKVIKASPRITVIVGFVDSRDDIFNAAAIIHDGKLAGVYHKIFLPNYGVFDGNRLIIDETGRLVAKGKQFEEDLVIADIDVESVFRTRLHDPRWRKELLLHEEQGWRQTEKIVISGTPTNSDKPDLLLRNVERLEKNAEFYSALVLGTRDYIQKHDVQKVLIGLSGGVDSSLVAAIAVDALGNDNVIGVAMPSRYSSPGSETDAELLAGNLGIKFLTIPIEKAFKAYLEMLEESFAGQEPNVTEENLQARIRGNILMALSNKFGWLVLTKGNKGETAN